MKKLFVALMLSAIFFFVSCEGKSKNDDKTDTGDTITDEDTGDTDSNDTEPTVDPTTEPTDDPTNPTTEPTTDDDIEPTSDEDADTTQEPNDDDTSDEESKEEAIYLGIIGFNNKLYTKKIERLSDSNVSEFKNFIDNDLKPQNLTALYYADDIALEMIREYKPLPDKLQKVALVTFTDGLDNQSTADEFKPEYSKGSDYLNDLHDMIINNPPIPEIPELSLDAYTIGLNSGDIPADLMSEFEDMLKKLASSNDNAFQVSDMDEVKARFKEIAEDLYKVSTTINMGVYIPGGYDDGQVIRYTFDNAESAENSNLYIQATYHKTNGVKTLEDIIYKGFKPGADTITSTKKGPNGELYFQFDDLKYSDGSTVSQNDIQNKSRLWKQTSSGSGWYSDSEINMAELPPDINEDKSSAMIMLVLDCTTSLGENFGTMQEAAKNFVETLLDGGKNTAAEATVEECTEAGGTWNNAQNICAKTSSCPSKPENTVWNDEGKNGTYTQTYTSSTGWTSSYSSEYNETPGICKYKCASSDYGFNGSVCVDKEGLAECDGNPASFPCKDLKTGKIWSGASTDKYEWGQSYAGKYCDNLDLGGFSWRLPNIDELRSTIKNCPATQTGGICGLTTSCLGSDCRIQDDCHCETNDTQGYYSILGFSLDYWSSNKNSSNTSYAWYVDFKDAGLYQTEYDPFGSNPTKKVVCIRKSN